MGQRGETPEASVPSAPHSRLIGSKGGFPAPTKTGFDRDCSGVAVALARKVAGAPRHSREAIARSPGQGMQNAGGRKRKKARRVLEVQPENVAGDACGGGTGEMHRRRFQNK